MQVHRTGSRYSFNVAAPRYFRRHLGAEPFDLVIEALNKVPVFSPAWSGRPGLLIVHHLFGATAFHYEALRLIRNVATRTRRRVAVRARRLR